MAAKKRASKKQITSVAAAKGAAAFSQALTQLQGIHGKELVKSLRGSTDGLIDGLSFGVPSLNFIFTGNPFIGIPWGRIIELIGPESSGKTTALLMAIANAQSQGYLTGFVDAEHSVDPRYAAALGVDLQNMLFTQPDYGEQGLQIAEDMIKVGARLIVVDSVAALTPKVFMEGSYEKIQPGVLANMMSIAMGKLSKVASKYQASVIFSNQIREKIGVMFGSPESTPGGKALKFYATIRARQTLSSAKDSKIKGSMASLTGKKEKQQMGSLATIRCIKNKVYPPFMDTTIPLYFGRGYDVVQDWFNLAEAFGVLRKGKGHYILGVRKIAFSEMEENLLQLQDSVRPVFSQFAGLGMRSSGDSLEVGDTPDDEKEQEIIDAEFEDVDDSVTEDEQPPVEQPAAKKKRASKKRSAKKKG